MKFLRNEPDLFYLEHEGKQSLWNFCLQVFLIIQLLILERVEKGENKLRGEKCFGV